jgi:hypothetical protein
VIEDGEGQVSLKARFLNELTFQITGRFGIAPGDSVIVEGDSIRRSGSNIEFQGMCFELPKAPGVLFTF